MLQVHDEKNSYTAVGMGIENRFLFRTGSQWTDSLAWMPDELSPAHNIVCSGSSVWHRSVEEKLCLVWKPTRPIKLSGRALYDDEQMIRPIKLSGRASYDAGQIPRAELPGRERAAPGPGRSRGFRAASGAPGPRAGLPGRAASGAPGPGRGAPGPRTGDTRGSYLAPGRSAACARRVPLTSGDILHFLVQ